MKKISLLLLLPFLVMACNTSDSKNNLNKVESVTEDDALELVDIRIYENGNLRINGSTLSESSLESHLDALKTNKETRVRISSSDQVYTGLVNRISREFAIRDLSNVKFNMMTADEFEQFEKDIMIDVLNNGQIMMDGNILYPADLEIALNQQGKPLKKLTVRLNVGDEITMGPLYDVQSILKKNGVYRISYMTNHS